MSREIPITAESVVSWNESPVATEVDREVVLMNVGRGRFLWTGRDRQLRLAPVGLPTASMICAAN